MRHEIKYKEILFDYLSVSTDNALVMFSTLRTKSQFTSVRKICIATQVPLSRGGAMDKRGCRGVLYARLTHPSTPLKRGIAQTAASFLSFKHS